MAKMKVQLILVTGYNLWKTPIEKSNFYDHHIVRNQNGVPLQYHVIMVSGSV